MNNISEYKFDAMLSVAVRNLGMNELEEFDKLDDSGVHFSPAFEKQRLKALGKGRRPVLQAKKVIKTILVACLALLSSIAMLGMAIPPVREAFVETVIECYEKYIEVELLSNDSVETPEIIEIKREPTDSLDGYQKEVVSDTMFLYNVMYKNDKMRVFYWQYTYSNYSFAFDNMDCSPTKVDIGKYQAELFLYDDPMRDKILIWSDGEYIYVLSGNILLDDMMKIAESVK